MMASKSELTVNIITVCPVLAHGKVDASLSGKALLHALERIIDASENQLHVLKIESGEYDLGNQTLKMKPYVDIEGSGQESTIITSSAAYQQFSGGTIEGADHAALSKLTVVSANPNKTGSSSAMTNDGVSPKLSHATFIANGPATNHPIVNKNSLPLLIGVTVIASGFSN